MSYFLSPLDHLLAETICGHLNVVDISGQKGIDGSVKTCINCATPVTQKGIQSGSIHLMETLDYVSLIVKSGMLFER